MSVALGRDWSERFPQRGAWRRVCQKKINHIYILQISIWCNVFQQKPLISSISMWIENGGNAKLILFIYLLRMYQQKISSSNFFFIFTTIISCQFWMNSRKCPWIINILHCPVFHTFMKLTFVLYYALLCLFVARYPEKMCSLINNWARLLLIISFYTWL